MAEKLHLTVKCHACGSILKGTAKYGKGAYSPEGLDFLFTAIGRIKEEGKKSKVKGEVSIICPNCTVRNKYII
jgi:hypothetical protein